MADILRSKEVYKRLNGVKPSQNPLRAVRGLYVSGEHREPYLIDHGITITSIITTKATIDNFTDANETLEPEHVLNFLGIENLTSTNITPYTRAYETLEPEHVLNFLGVETLTTSNILNYTSRKVSLESDHVLNILDVYDLTPSTLTLYTSKKVNMQPESMIYINSVGSTKASITDIDVNSIT